MKILSINRFICLLGMFLFLVNGVAAQEKTAEISIKTSAVCSMCKKKIEKALRFKGVEKSNLDLQTKTVTVSYDPAQTNPEKIREAITMAGYDADELKANPKAYKKLDECCKKQSEHP